MLNLSRYPVVVTLADRFGYGLLLLLALLLPMTYMPFMEGAQLCGMALSGLWHKLILAVFSLLLMLSMVNVFPKDLGVFRMIILFIGVMLLEWLILEAFLIGEDFGIEIRMLIIPLCAFWVGWRMSLDERHIRILTLVFALGVVLVGLAVIYVKGSGFSITSEYFAERKNSLGPMLATAAVLCMGLVLSSKGRKNIPMLFIGLALVGLCVLLVLTIRARAAFLAVVLVLLLMLFQRFKSKYTLLSVWVAILIVVAVFIILPHSMKQYVHQSLFSGFSGGDISSGRIERNRQVISVLAQDPLFGHLVNPTEVAVAHNFLLWELYEFGLIGAFPILFIYFLFLIMAVRNTIQNHVTKLRNIGCYTMLVLFVISMFEYTLPFGPGTSTVMSFVFFGMALKAPLEGESFIKENQ